MFNYNSLISRNLSPFTALLREQNAKRFYVPQNNYIVFEFHKNGKQISHFSKVYRGLVLRCLAKNNIQTIKELESMQIDGLSLLEVIKQKNKIVYKFDIAS